MPSTIMDSGEHILVEPVGEPETLLGRHVIRRPNGGYEISDARAPGCKVTPRKKTSKWRRTFHQKVDDVAGSGVNLSRFIALKAGYKKGVRIKAEVTNIETLESDSRGNCGDLFIASVKIGTGQRTFQYLEKLEGGANVGWKTLSAGGQGSAAKDIEATLTWDTPQAWAFTIGSVKDEEQAEISIIMPEYLKPGERFEPVITAGPRDLWIIVISCDGTEACVVLRPTPKIPTEFVPAGRSIKLWPMEAMAAAGGCESHEKMIVYGFPEEEDFKAFLPPAGALSVEDSTEYAITLYERLREKQEIPSRRWVRSEFRYVVESARKSREGGRP
ncbi:MAG: hypothetical protein JXA30_12215 [Deltaproteobacteria bacterium]|nr:hypothetical protein [Deltaproteobacteria bacterium]